MPNHCNNTLGITGPKKDIEEFIELVTNKGPDKDENEYELFNNLLPMPKELVGTTSPSKEGNVDLIDKYGFSNDIFNGKLGNNIAMQLVMDGLKLQPCSPGFVDARDAILLADSLNNKFKNKDLLWKAFARRGLGYKASQGASSSTFDGSE